MVYLTCVTAGLTQKKKQLRDTCVHLCVTVENRVHGLVTIQECLENDLIGLTLDFFNFVWGVLLIMQKSVIKNIWYGAPLRVIHVTRQGCMKSLCNGTH